MHEDARNLYAATSPPRRLVSGSPSRSCTSRPPTASSMRPASTWLRTPARSRPRSGALRPRPARVRQLAMLEGDRFEVLDITVRPESKLCGVRFRDLPMTGLLIGAIVRDGEAVFPRGEDMLLQAIARSSSPTRRAAGGERPRPSSSLRSPSPSSRCSGSSRAASGSPRFPRTSWPDCCSGRTSPRCSRSSSRPR